MLQNSGTIKFSEIANEFGLPPNKNLGAYRVSQNYGSLTNLPLDSGIPQGNSTIKFSNFYGKTLNMVVDLYNTPSGGSYVKQNAKSRYNDGFVAIVGGFRGKPQSTETKKVFVNINTTIGSDKTSRTSVAFRTGTWDANTTLQVDIGSSGEIYGAGGDGGNGKNGNFTPGKDGSSAIGIEYSGTKLVNKGYIQCGFGGGGGGGFGSSDPDKNTTDYGSAGGGGGGGAGFPAGVGGLLGTGSYNVNTATGSNGNAGSKKVRGLGGSGMSGGGSSGGKGGNGGDPSNAAQTGGSGGGNLGGSAGTAPGNNGYSIVYAPSIINVTIDNQGSLIGTATTSSFN